jgi:hypothetical protein
MLCVPVFPTAARSEKRVDFSESGANKEVLIDRFVVPDASNRQSGVSPRTKSSTFSF